MAICIRISKDGKDLYSDVRFFSYKSFTKPMSWSGVMMDINDKNRDDFAKERKLVDTHKILTFQTTDASVGSYGLASMREIANLCEEAAGGTDKFKISLFERQGSSDSWNEFGKKDNAGQTAELKDAQIMVSKVTLDDKNKPTVIATFQVIKKKK